jgi:hypothetical protein
VRVHGVDGTRELRLQDGGEDLASDPASPPGADHGHRPWRQQRLEGGVLGPSLPLVEDRLSSFIGRRAGPVSGHPVLNGV